MRTIITAPCAVTGCASTAESGRSPLCRTHRYRNDRYGCTDDPITPRTCDVCRLVFTPARADSRVCADPACRSEYYRRVKRRYKLEGALSPRTPRISRRGFEIFTRSEIGDRDDWICGLCREPVDPERAPDNPRAPTLAHHVHPDNGGLHTRENCFIAHRDCRAAHGEPIY